MADLDDARTNDDGKTIDMDDAGGASNLNNSPAKRISELDEATQFRVLRANWEADRAHSAVWRIQCADDFGFRAGEQLTEEDKALLNAQQRPHIVFNRVLTILKAVAGMEINGRHEIQYLPRNNEDTAPNEVLSAASKWMGDGCDAEDEQSQAFDDCATCGMGWCLSDDALVRLPNTHFVTTRLYSGDVISIDLENGKSLTGTPNHPVLTDRGWKGLHELKEDDNLVNSAFLDVVHGLPVHQFDNVETRLKDKIDAFRTSGEAIRFATQDSDFYSDGAGSEVHIVYADSLLSDKLRQSSARQHPMDNGFVFGDFLASARALFSRDGLIYNPLLAAKNLFALLWRHFPRPDMTRMDVVSQRVTGSPQPPTYRHGIKPDRRSDLDGGEISSKVQVDQFLNRSFSGRAGGPRSQDVPGFPKAVHDAGFRYSNLIADFFDWKPALEIHVRHLSGRDGALSGFVTRVKSRIVREVENFAVHDVGTSLGFFVAGGIITSNTENRFSHFKDPQGNYIEEQIDPREMYWDRTAKKKNLSDARRMHRVRKMPLGDAMRMFPGKNRQELNAVWAEGFNDQGETQSIEQKRMREENTTDASYDDTNEVTIVHTQWWEDEPFWLVADPDSGEMHEVTTKEYRILALQMARLGMKIDAEKMSRQVFKQAFLGSVMLKKAAPAPINGQFSWTCITGEIDKVKGTFFGLIKVMRDPQMWANRFLSQTMQIMNTTAKGGIMAETDAFDDQRQAEDSYAQPEAITWVASGALSGQKPKILPKPGQGMADGYVNLMQFAISSIKDVTGINMELLGLQDQNQPGILEAQRKQAGMTILATLFDSLRRARKITGRARLDIIQRKMSDGRLIRVVGNESTQAVRLVKDKTFGEYDVIVDDAPTSPNQKEANWAIIQPLLVVFKEQLMANPTIIAQVLEYSPLPSKLVDLIKQMALQAQNDPKAQQLKEIMTQLQIRGVAAKVHKDESGAVLNEAKAVEAHSGGLYSEAMAKNMLEDNQNAGMKALFDAIDSYAKVKNADSKAELTAAQVRREHIGAASDVLDMHHRHAEAGHGAGAALTTMARDIAGARKDHATADLTERTPAPLPMKPNANAGA